MSPARRAEQQHPRLQRKFHFCQKFRLDSDNFSHTSQATLKSMPQSLTYICAPHNIYKQRISCTSFLSNHPIHNPTACFKSCKNTFFTYHHFTLTPKSKRLWLFWCFKHHQWSIPKLINPLRHSRNHSHSSHDHKNQSKRISPLHSRNRLYIKNFLCRLTSPLHIASTFLYLVLCRTHKTQTNKT